MKRSVVPDRALRGIADAGASLFAWRDREFLLVLDPGGRLTRIGTGATVFGSLLAAVIIVGSTWHLAGLWAAAAAMLGAGRFFPRIPWWPLSIAASAIGAGDHMAPIWAAVAATVLQLVTEREIVGRAAAATWALIALVAPIAALIVALVVAAAACGVSLYLGGAPFGPLTAKQVTTRVPAPAPKVPWLVSLLKRSALKNPPQDIKRKSAGGFGERMTALALLGLPRFKYAAIAHDVALPGADRANIDHILISRCGVFALDSKVLRGQLAVEDRDVFVSGAHGRESVLPLINGIARQARVLSGKFAAPVRPVLVVHDATMTQVLDVALASGEIVTVVPGSALLAWLNTQTDVVSKPDAAILAEAVRGLSANDGGRVRLVQPLGMVGGRSLRTLDLPTRTISLVASDARVPVPMGSAAQPVVAADDRTAEEREAELRWAAMAALPAAAPESLPEPEMARITEGSPVTVVSAESGQLVEKRWIAVSRVIAAEQPGGSPRLFITTPEWWTYRQQTGKAIWFTASPTDRIFAEPEGL